MENSQIIPVLTFLTTGISLLVGIALPVGSQLFLNKKYGCTKKPFFTGCAVFLIFVLVLESALNAIILGGGRAQQLMQKPILFAIFGGLIAGIFEETGRFVAFKTVLKNHDNDNTALAYGAGHGGFEAFVILFSSMITNIVFGILINTGNTSQITANLSGAELEKINQTLESLCTTNSLLFLLAPVERIAAMTVHISLSVIVWFSVKKHKKLFMFPAAILIHTLFNAVAAWLSLKKTNSLLIETIIYIMAALIAVLALNIWKKEHVKTKTMIE